VAGVPVGLLVAQILRSSVAGFAILDPVAVVSAIAALLSVAAAAAVLAAARVARINPVRVLRSE
jgi:ABC-type antimicrobial peptide transport system permease subunit